MVSAETTITGIDASFGSRSCSSRKAQPFITGM